MLSALIFWTFAGIAVVFAVGVIVCRNPMHSAVCLVATLAGIAGVFLHLHAEFLAWLQILVYTGAVMVLIIFTVALLNLGRDERIELSTQRRWGVVFALGFLALMGVYFALDKSFGFGGPIKNAVGLEWGGTVHVATYLFGPYIYAVELAAVLLTGAVVGAVMLTRKSPDTVE